MLTLVISVCIYIWLINSLAPELPHLGSLIIHIRLAPATRDSKTNWFVYICEEWDVKLNTENLKWSLDFLSWKGSCKSGVWVIWHILWIYFCDSCWSWCLLLLCSIFVLFSECSSVHCIFILLTSFVHKFKGLEETQRLKSTILNVWRKSTKNTYHDTSPPSLCL